MARFTGFLVLLLIASPGYAQAKKEADPLMFTQVGNLPIIISAPHGGRKPIPDVPEQGDGISKFVVVRDTNTDELAQKILVAIEKKFGAKPYGIIAHFERKYLDVNREAKAAYESEKAKPYYDKYHEFLGESCKAVQAKWGRGILLDIHGQGVDAEVIFRGTNDGKSDALLIKRFGKEAVTGPKSLLGQLVKKNYKVFPALDSNEGEDKRFNGGYIVQTYGSSQGSAIDAIQLEWGGNARLKAKLDQTATDVAEALAVFAEAYLPKEPKQKP